MGRKTKHMLQLFLAAALTVNTLAVSAGSTALASEVASGNVALPSAAQTRADIPAATKYIRDTSGTIEVGGVYAIVFVNARNQNRVLYNDGSSLTDVFNGRATSEEYTVTGFTPDRQLWQVVDKGSNQLALKRLDNENYLDLSTRTASKVKVATSAAEVKFTFDAESETYKISDATGANFLCGRTDGDGHFYTDAESVDSRMHLFKRTQIAEYRRPKGTTQGQPFAVGTGGSNNFRIPCIVTLSTGRVVAVADARWNHDLDGRAIDVMVSYSDDNGENWTYNTPMYFNDSVDPKCSNPNAEWVANDQVPFNNASTIMDPVLIKDNNDKLYLLADLFPGSVAIEAAVPQKPAAASGYVNIEGKDRLVLYSTNKANAQNNDNYTYYVGDYGADGYAPVYAKSDKAVHYYVDKWFYLYDSNKQNMYCPQIGATDTVVRQNIFFYNADLHVRCATYLMLVTSEDGGQTWSDPSLINSQVLKDGEMFYGAGPGTGICLSDGTLMFPMYRYTGSGNSQKSSFIYSKDGGASWTRSDDATGNPWSSESVLVKLSETKVRQFIRCANSKLSYVDHTLQGDGRWTTDQQITILDQKVKDNNQLSALRTSKTVDGKPVILVSTATTNSATDIRADGRIYTYALNEDGTMTLLSEFDVWPVGSSFPHGVNYADGKECYTYSSLTEQKNGTIGLLVETDFKPAKITYRNLTFEEACPGVVFDANAEVGE